MNKVAWLKIWVKIIILRRKRQKCLDIVFKICSVGYGNGTAQEYLNRAKDRLYSAASEFDSQIMNLRKELD
ncbi:MAG TPA: hypothetical protein ENH82_14050 [bacterium]|nr:hypothetical protein [bacterium]